jgi:hypothetical protein
VGQVTIRPRTALLAGLLAALAALVSCNQQFHTSPAWGSLAGGASCATAVGPGAALALAGPAGHVASYLPSPSQATAAVLSRCPLTVVDLETAGYPERPSAPASEDAELARIVAGLFTVALLGLDVMTGSRLQLDTPFGLSMIESGRYYGIGNAALGVYGVTALFGAAWLGLVALRRYPRRAAVLTVAVVGLFAVFASGWPGPGRALADAGDRLAGRRLGGPRACRGAALRGAAGHRRPGRRRVP